MPLSKITISKKTVRLTLFPFCKNVPRLEIPMFGQRVRLNRLRFSKIFMSEMLIFPPKVESTLFSVESKGSKERGEEGRKENMKQKKTKIEDIK